jgi:hypothetical protein
MTSNPPEFVPFDLALDRRALVLRLDQDRESRVLAAHRQLQRDLAVERGDRGLDRVADRGLDCAFGILQGPERQGALGTTAEIDERGFAVDRDDLALHFVADLRLLRLTCRARRQARLEHGGELVTLRLLTRILDFGGRSLGRLGDGERRVRTDFGRGGGIVRLLFHGFS